MWHHTTYECKQRATTQAVRLLLNRMLIMAVPLNKPSGASRSVCSHPQAPAPSAAHCVASLSSFSPGILWLRGVWTRDLVFLLLFCQSPSYFQHSLASYSASVITNAEGTYDTLTSNMKPTCIYLKSRPRYGMTPPLWILNDMAFHEAKLCELTRAYNNRNSVQECMKQ
jgi:hypothetical protein